MEQHLPLSAFQQAVLSHSTEATKQPEGFSSSEMSQYSEVLQAGFPTVGAGATAGAAGIGVDKAAQPDSELQAQTVAHAPVSEGRQLPDTVSASATHPFMPPPPPGTGTMPAPAAMSPSLHNLLMSWYWCGYYAGQHDAAQGSRAQPGHS